MNLAASPAFLPVATTFTEKAATALGLEEIEALSLTLATEEIFLHLCQKAPGKAITISCRGGSYFVQVEFEVPVEDLNLRAFNFTSRASLEEESHWEDLGLILASRSVDRFEIWEERGRGLHLIIYKEKKYPPLPETPPPQAHPLSRISLHTPDREELKYFAQMACAYYPAYLLPPFFPYPGKAADMAADGAFKAVVAVDPQGHLGGGILWYWRGSKIIAGYGPFLFNQGPDTPLATNLLDAVLEDIVRTKAVGLLIRYPTPELPFPYFEPLGSFSFFQGRGNPLTITVYFRHLHEDTGSLAWTHSSITPFLQDAFQKMVLPREMREVSDYGEMRNPCSVLSVRFDRRRDLANLFPMRPGADEAKNLADHLSLLQKEGWRNIFFEMDLAKPWQVEFAPALIQNRFRPSLLLPHAGEGDILVFQALPEDR
jgi:hypothetical protein